MQPRSITELLRAIDLAEADDWDAAHGIAQEHEGNPMADWIHAALHKIEGDAPNSRYWYSRAGRMESFGREPAEEWKEIRNCLRENSGV